MLRVWLCLGAMVALTPETGLAAQYKGTGRPDCVVRELKSYYGVKLDKKYDTRSQADEIAGSLYAGPLMREPDRQGQRYLAALIRKEKMEVGELEDIVRGHLYGESDEFSQRLEELSKGDGGGNGDPAGAASKILDSIYKQFGYRPDSWGEADFDVCLVLNGKAHLVVTKAAVAWMERRGLDR